MISLKRSEIVFVHSVLLQVRKQILQHGAKCAADQNPEEATEAVNLADFIGIVSEKFNVTGKSLKQITQESLPVTMRPAHDSDLGGPR